jgi:transposase
MIRSGGPGACCRWPTNGSPGTAGSVSRVCWTPGTRKARPFTAWHAKEVVRSIYAHTNPAAADEFVTRLAADLQDEDCPPEVNRLGRTLARWKDQIVAWHRSHVTNAATEAVNNLLKRVKRAAFGFTNFAHYRTRILLYTGGINWDPLPTATPH